MAEDQYPDLEGGVRDWLRADSGVSAIAEQRGYFGIPATPTFPLFTVQRVGGLEDESGACIDEALVQIDVWGELYADASPSRKGGNKAEADALRRAIRTALRRINGATVITTGVVAYGASVLSDPYQPDPDSGRPRYVITASITARTGSLTSS